MNDEADMRQAPAFAWQTRPAAEWTGPNGTSGTDWSADFFDASITQFELSGTGHECLIFDAVYRFLLMLQRGSRLIDMPEDASAAMAAELASNAGFVEYGVSLRCAWLEPAGEVWMADYQAWLLRGKP